MSTTKLHASRTFLLRAIMLPAFVFALMFTSRGSSAADYTVTDCTDAMSSNTLRGVVSFVVSQGVDNKSVDVSGCATITLTQGEIRIPISMTISGAGQGTTIDANLASRVFSSFDGLMNGFNKTLTLANLGIVHGRHFTANSLPASGGCIDVYAVILQDSVVSDCAATTMLGQVYGGAINAGYVTLTDSRVENGLGSSGTQDVYGGAIRASFDFTCTRSSVSGSHAGTGGGSYGYGGGLYAAFNATLTGCTIDSNSADIGAGIYSAGNLDLTDSTVSGNSATTAGTGGIEGDSITITYSTISNNLGYCGGVAGGTIAMNSTIIAKNHSYFNDCDDLSAGGPVTGANNFVGVVYENTVVPEGTISGDPILTPLADHGGPTPTHALSVNSPAIDHGGTTLLTTDQRGAGFARVVGAAADIGAYERQAGDEQLLYAGFE